MKKRWWLVILPLLAVGAFLYFRPGREVFEIPVGYKGPIVVFLNHPAGQKLAWDWGRRTYKIPKTGVLLVQNDDTSGMQVTEWVYVDDSGKAITSIPQDDDAHPDERATSVVVRMQRTHVEEDITWFEAQIGIPADPDSFGTPPHFVADEVKEARNRKR
jgi:hypothetical protein